jgi:hypothetical protein
MFEAEHLAALWVDSGHHVLDGPVLSRCIHPLKDQLCSMPTEAAAASSVAQRALPRV